MTTAVTWIGISSHRDSLDLDKISTAVSSEAKHLHQILNSAKVSGLMRIRRQLASAAAKAQRDFRRLSLVAILGTAIATLSSGLLLYGEGSKATSSMPAGSQTALPPQASPPAPSTTPAGAALSDSARGLVQWIKRHETTIKLFQISSLLISGVAAAVLGGLKLVERWADNRSKAETLRRDIFNEIMNDAYKLVPEPLPAADPGNPIAQAVEFFRRYQHELQVGFYTNSIERHERAAKWLTWLTAVLAGLAAVAGMTAALGDLGVIIGAFLGIAVPILLAAAQTWRATSRDADKADAYRKAKEALERSLLRLDDVRAKVALGDAAAAREYVDSVHIIMTTESGAWTP